uniref:Partial AB-hydrolase lipase domain-containing protein n=1 Tax=Lutzomyia longipalpis TaxID=7200 RepID=A0A1B0CG72_LUTLO
MLSLRPEYNDRILSAHALAPVAFMNNLRSPFVRAFAPFVDSLDTITSLLGMNEFMPSNSMMQMGGYLTCRDSSPFQEVCSNVLFLIAGFNSEQLNRTQLPAIMANTPAGAATRQLVHYGQLYNSGHFRQFDHGRIGNWQEYGSFSPPDYPLDRITAPIALHFSDNDWLAAVVDVQRLRSQLRNVIGAFRVPLPAFNHLDFQWAIDIRPLVYNRHGLFSSSTDFVVIGPGNALGYLLVDQGYDVWMGNCRGNTYSRTTSMFAMLSLLPSYNDLIVSAHALAPAVLLGHLKNPAVHIVINILDKFGLLIGYDESLENFEALPSNNITQLTGNVLCRDGSPVQEFCVRLMHLFFGDDPMQINRTLIPLFTSNVPAGASFKSGIHFLQLSKSGHFRPFDYGLAENMKKYGSRAPSDYPLERITAPISLHYGENDWDVAAEDVEVLGTRIRNLIGAFPVPFAKFNHADFLIAKDAKNLPEIIQSNGYPVESHVVQTTDGYLLTVHRIPHGKTPQGRLRTNKPIVLLQHGFFHEMALHDLPDTIDYILKRTGRKKLSYVGHSQGTTIMFAMLSSRPSYNDLIVSAHALAPSAFLSHLRNPAVRISSLLLLDRLGLLVNFMGNFEVLPSIYFFQMTGHLMCADGSPLQDLCSLLLYLGLGDDPMQLNKTLLAPFTANIPSGASTKQAFHYLQLVNSGHFRPFDYGPAENMKKYGSRAPPDYPLERITAPISLHYSDNDWLISVEDVDKLRRRIPNLIGAFRVPYPKFNHADYLLAIDIKSL